MDIHWVGVLKAWVPEMYNVMLQLLVQQNNLQDLTQAIIYLGYDMSSHMI